MTNPSKHRPDSSAPGFPLPILILLAVLAIIVIFGILHTLHGKPAPSRQDFAQSISNLEPARAETHLVVTGTLAPLGSFEYETAPIETRLAVLDLHAKGAFERREITREQAAEIKADTDSIEAIVAQATRVCDPAPHSGKCQAPRAKVDELLALGERDLSTIPDYAPQVQY